MAWCPIGGEGTSLIKSLKAIGVETIRYLLTNWKTFPTLNSK